MVAVPLGFAVLAAARGRGAICRGLRIGLIGLLGLPVILQAAAWDSAFGKLGWWTAGQGGAFQPFWNSWTAAIWIHAVAAAPQVAVILWLAETLSPRAWQEQAELEGDRLAVFWHVTFPRLVPVLMTGLLWTMVSTTREIAVTDLYQIGTLAEQIYLGFAWGPLAGETDPALTRWGGIAGSGVGLTVALIGWLAVGMIGLFLQLLPRNHESSQRLADARWSRPGSWRSWLALGLGVLLVAVPLANLLVRASFQVNLVQGVPQPGYSAAAAAAALRRAVVDQADAFQWSLLIATGSTVGLLVLAIPAAWRARRSRLFRGSLIVSLALGAAIPGPLIGKALASLFSRMGGSLWGWLYNDTIFAPVMANMVFCWPLAGLLAWFVVADRDEDAVSQARLEGITGLQRLWQFAIVNHLPRWLGCGLILGAVSFGELSASRMVLPPGMQTIPGRILGFMHAGVDEMTAALALVTAALLAGLIGMGAGLLWLPAWRKRTQWSHSETD